MIPELVTWLGLSVAVGGSTLAFLAWDWRWQLGYMACVYLGAAILAASHWPLGMAVALLVTGWMSVALMGMSLTPVSGRTGTNIPSAPQSRGFRLLIAGMIVILGTGSAAGIDRVVAGIGLPTAIAALVLVGIGLLQTGTTENTAAILFGLLMALAGFEVFYSAVEGSILVAGMLSAATLGLGLVGAYLISGHEPEESL